MAASGTAVSADVGLRGFRPRRFLATIGLIFLIARPPVLAEVEESGAITSQPDNEIQEGSWRVDLEDGEQTTHEWSTYSVILVSTNPHPSNLFRERARAEAHTRGILSVQITNPNPSVNVTIGAAGQLSNPFLTSHDERADKRVRIIYAVDLPGKSRWKSNLTEHLKAACGDPTERTVLIITDETCAQLSLPAGLPPACWYNIARHYPFNAPSPQEEQRDFYIPLGPRDTFAYIPPAMVSDASARPHLVNLVVTTGTSPRRQELVDIVHEYESENPGLDIQADPEHLDAEEWQDLLLNSRFTLTPGGHAPETFRMFEALEAGSIPIISKMDYTDPGFHKRSRVEACGTGNAAWNTVAASPFAVALAVDSWSDLPELLDRLQNESDDYINQLQADCRQWYDALLNRTYHTLLHSGDGLEMWPQAGPITLDGGGEEW